MNHLDLDTLVLTRGSHVTREDGVCLMEAVAWWAGEDHSDHPVCVSPLLIAFGATWNDRMHSDAERASLRTYIPLLVGTAGDAEADQRRAWLALDWLTRTALPAWLRLAGLMDEAEALAATPAVVSAVTIPKDALAAAWDAAKDGAKVIRAAAEAVAWAADGAVTEAIGASIWTAVWAVTEATGDALEPTSLQTSAHQLFQRMISAT